MLKNVKYVTPKKISNPSSSLKHLCISRGENLENNQEHICILGNDRRPKIPWEKSRRRLIGYQTTMENI
jgi:hypothetical protein